MEKENEIRKVIVYGNYFWEFYNAQNKKTQDKIDWILDILKTVLFIPGKYFKHLSGTNGLYEIRVMTGSDIFRIFCFFDEGKLIVLLNGFQKKSERTPRNELEKGILLKKQYYESKKK